MLTLPESVALPLKEDEGGNIRVSGTRVTLHTLITSYKKGYTPEEIHESFERIPLPDVYAVIAYYLANQQSVEDYMRQVDEEGDRWQAFWEARYTPEQKARLQELKQLAAKRRKEREE